MKLGSMSPKGLLANFGVSNHSGKIHGKYVLKIEADMNQFAKGVQLMEFARLKDLMEFVERISRKV
ncbi:DUF3898 domain-containing protein [Peribacillus sp. NPDC097895]|uniref:DUF3898 domain-containing protein n=1 Tax=Peribacillus sp. NPDC097895 TaxID=3390619 RepID=UPI003CFCE4A3